MRKIVGISVIAALVMSFFVFPVSADGFSVLSTTPQNGQRLVSAIDDAVITFSAEVDETTMAGNITVSPAAAFTLKKLGTKVMVLFGSQLDYLTEYTVSVGSGLRSKGGDAVTPMSFTFKTEYDPITTLFYEDFEDADAALAKFSQNGSAVSSDIYSVENGALKINAYPYTASDYYPIISANPNIWRWFNISYDIKQDNDTRLITLFRSSTNMAGGQDNGANRIESWMSYTAAGDGYLRARRASNANVSIFNFVPEATIGANDTTDYSHFSMNVEKGDTALAGKVNVVVTKPDETAYSLASIEDGSYFGSVTGYLGVALFGTDTTKSATIDNLVVTDIGWYPKNLVRKNITDTIELNMDQGLAAGDTYNNIKVETLDGTEVAKTVSLQTTYPRKVIITLSDPIPGTTYKVTVPRLAIKTGNANSQYHQFMSNDKVFTVKTAPKDPLYSEPVEQEAGVMTFDGAQNTYSRAFSVDNIDEWENYKSLIVKQEGGEARGKSFEKLGIGGLSGSGTVGFIISGLPTPNTTSIRFTDTEIE